MKIAIVCYPTFGGSGVVATELGMALAAKGYEIHFVTYRQPVRLDTLASGMYFHEVNVPQYDLFKYQPYELALSSKLVDVIKQHQIDILHVHYAIPHAYAAYMAKKMLEDKGVHIPIVTTLHGTDITLVGSHPFYKTAVTFSINHSDYVTAVSESLKQNTLDLFGVSKEIKVIPNFIDVNKYEDREPPCGRDVLAEKEEKVITHVSNFRPLKRIMDVMAIFERIIPHVNAKLMMVGQGPEKEKAEFYCRKNDLENKVLFLGNSHEIDKILCHSDLFLLPSEQESFGLAALEAMVQKVPVISTNAGGLPEVNQEGVSGYLCEVGDVDRMAEKAVSILTNPEQHQKMKQQAFETATHFDIKKVVLAYEEVYEKANMTKV